MKQPRNFERIIQIVQHGGDYNMPINFMHKANNSVYSHNWTVLIQVYSWRITDDLINIIYHIYV